MKKLSIIKKYRTVVVCDDGSTLHIDYPHEKRNIHLTTDLTNNPIFNSPLDQSHLDKSKKLPSKRKALQFDFSSLISKTN